MTAFIFNAFFRHVAVTLGILIVTASQAIAAPPEPTPEQKRKWEAVVPHLVKADKQSTVVGDEELKQLAQFLEGPKSRSGQFADEMLSVETKLRAGGNAAEQGAKALYNGLSEFVGLDPLGLNGTARDKFEEFVQERFEAIVLPAGSVDKAIKECVQNYERRLTAIEARLLVDLKADLPDAQLAPAVAEPAAPGVAAGGVARVVIEASKIDLLVTIGEFAASDTVGNIVDGLVENLLGGWLPKSGPIISGIIGGLTDIAVGIGIDMAIKTPDYSPRQKIMAGVEAEIGRMASSILDGDLEVSQAFWAIHRVALGHPDKTLRRLCSDAAIAMSRDGKVGLKWKLGMANDVRINARFEVFHRQVFGADLEPHLLFPLEVDDVAEIDADGRFISMIQDVLKRYRGVKP